jgi:hypothetical protein
MPFLRGTALDGPPERPAPRIMQEYNSAAALTFPLVSDQGVIFNCPLPDGAEITATEGVILLNKGAGSGVVLRAQSHHVLIKGALGHNVRIEAAQNVFLDNAGHDLYIDAQLIRGKTVGRDGYLRAGGNIFLDAAGPGCRIESGGGFRIGKLGAGCRVRVKAGATDFGGPR